MVKGRKRTKSGKSKSKVSGRGQKGRFGCEQCGLVVRVVDSCSCDSACDLYCCGEQMRRL